MRMVMTGWLVLLAVVASAGALEVPLSVEEPVGVAREREVVSGGIPLPQGKYKDATAFSLWDGTRVVPLQVSPIVRYPDGSLHWVLLSFPVTIAANARKTYVLKDTKVKFLLDAAVTVKEDGDLVEVSNGDVSFAVNKANFNGFEWLRYRGQEIFKTPRVALVANGQGGRDKLTHFSFPYRGSVRTTIYLRGNYGEQTTPTWAMTITLNVGESAVHINHNLRNAGLGAESMNVSAPKLSFGLASPLEAGEGGSSEKGSFGWQRFSGAVDLLVFLRHGGTGKTRLHKAFVEDGELVVDLSFDGSEMRLARATHKLTEIDLVFDKGANPDALSEPLHALASCAWYSAHDSMGVGRGFGSLADETRAYRNYNLLGAGVPRGMPAEKPYPDLLKRWLDVHGTSECDQLQGLTLQYLRTGQRGFLDRAHAWCRYMRSHYLWRTDDYVFGIEGQPRVGKWGGGRWCNCHAYGVGLFNYALLTGNVDALEAAYDAAEHANAVYGSTSKVTPGDSFSWWGSRPFARLYLIVARAYDVARNKEWQEALVHYVQVATHTPSRDPRGFTNHDIISTWTERKLRDLKDPKKGSPDAVALYEKEGTEIITEPKEKKGMCRHPKYGEWHPRCVASWAETYESAANYLAVTTLAAVDDPVVQIALDDARDYLIAESYFGTRYIYDPRIKQVYYYFYVDFPIPDYVPMWKGGPWAKPVEEIRLNSWYTRFWPDPVTRGYLLTGDQSLLDKAMEMWVRGANYDYFTLARAPDTEIYRYASIEWNTKGDWVTPVALTSGVAARPREDTVPPDAITDLQAKALGGGRVELSWTSPRAADGERAARYQVKFAGKPIKDYVDVNWRDEWRTITYWNMASNVAGEPLPQAPGKRERMVLAVPVAKTYLAIRSEDDESNRSKLSNVVEVVLK